MHPTFSEFANYNRLAQALSNMSDFPQKTALDGLANELVGAIKRGNKLIVFGNGGSAAEASHFAAELVSKCSKDHSPWPAICLSDSSPVLTAIGNDYGFNQVFLRQVEGHLAPGDVVIGFSTSGKSENVLSALEFSAGKNNPTFLFTGSNKELSISNQIITIHAQLGETPRIQEMHLVWIHLLSEFCELNLA
jgi:D-sedoheptulose 7-phosphate isomerase